MVVWPTAGITFLTLCINAPTVAPLIKFLGLALQDHHEAAPFTAAVARLTRATAHEARRLRRSERFFLCNWAEVEAHVSLAPVLAGIATPPAAAAAGAFHAVADGDRASASATTLLFDAAPGGGGSSVPVAWSSSVFSVGDGDDNADGENEMEADRATFAEENADPAPTPLDLSLWLPPPLPLDASAPAPAGPVPPPWSHPSVAPAQPACASPDAAAAVDAAASPAAMTQLRLRFLHGLLAAVEAQYEAGELSSDAFSILRNALEAATDYGATPLTVWARSLAATCTRTPVLAWLAMHADWPPFGCGAAALCLRPLSSD